MKINYKTKAKKKINWKNISNKKSKKRVHLYFT